MKSKVSILFFGFFILICVSCKDSETDKEVIKVSIEKIQLKDSKELLDELVTQIDSSEIINTDFVNTTDINQDCIFDQTTQTDEFLKNVQELEGYVWFPKEKKAQIVLNDHSSLIIKRGGCDHFELSATFFYERLLDIENEKDKQQIFDSVIWITSVLEDFDGEAIKRTIEENRITITKRDKFNYHANFMDENLYELYYFNFSNENSTKFEIGYYYN